MPHDCCGRKIETGDEVIMRFTVVAVDAKETECNVNLRGVDFDPGSPSGETYMPMVSCNTKLAMKCERPAK